MERAIEVFAVLNFLVIGFSHIFQHEAWGEFFALLRSHGRAGAFANGFLSLISGTLIVSFHNVWRGIPAILTVLGWCLVLKSVSIFLMPELNLRSMEIATQEHSRRFAAAGAIFIFLAAALGYELWRGQ